MNFTSPLFLLFCFLAVLGLRISPAGIARTSMLLTVNTIFVASFFTHWSAALPLIAFVLIAYGAILVAKTRPRPAMGICIALLVFLFVWLKRYVFVDALPPLSMAYSIIGLSYILFRVLHLLIDVAQGTLPVPRFTSYLNYLFFFLNFTSGPIQRYEDFSKQMQAKSPPLDRQQTHNALGRIVLGYFMVAVVSSIASHLSDGAQAHFYAALTGTNVWLALASYVGAILIYFCNLYANFAGYMNIVIGVGLLAGFTLPENFNRPFEAKNFHDLWARWHITLSNWFRYYLFNPLLKIMMARTGTGKIAPYLGAIAFFVTFLVMGVWHGSTPAFVIYGLFLGFGATWNSFWQIWAAKLLGRAAYKKLCAQPWYFHFSRALTLSYFSVALTCLWISPREASLLTSPYGFGLAAAAIAIMTASGLALGVILYAFFELVRKASRSEKKQTNDFIAMTAILLAINLTIGFILAIAIRNGAPISLPHLVAALIIFSVTLAGCAIACGLLDGAIADPSLSHRAPMTLEAWMALRIFVALTLSVQLTTAVPEFIYRAF